VRDEAWLKDLVTRFGALASEDAQAAQITMFAGYRLNLLLVNDADRNFGTDRIIALEAYRDGALQAERPDLAIGPTIELASVHGARGEAERALETIEATRAEVRDQLAPEHRYQLTYLDQECASLHTRQANWSAALAALDRADALAQELGREALARVEREFLVDECDVMRAHVFMKMGLPDRAEPIIRRALPQLEAALGRGRAVRGRLITAYRIRVGTYIATGRDLEALDYAKRVLAERQALFEAKGSGRGALQLLAGIACRRLAFGAPERLGRARGHLREALASEELDPLDSFECSLYLARVEIDAGRFDQATAHVQAAREQLAASTVLPLRTRALLDALRARLARARGEGRAQLRERHEALQTSANDLFTHLREDGLASDGHGYLRYDDYRLIIAELIESTLAAAPSDGAAWEAALRTDALNSLARSSAAPPATLEAVQRHLVAPGVGILAIVPAEAASHMFALDARGILHARAQDWPTLARLIDRFTVDMSRADGRETGHELVTALIPTAIHERMASWDTLLILGRDQLRNLRFEALPHGATGFLGLEYAIGYLPSLAWATQRARARTDDASGDARPAIHLISSPLASPTYTELPPVALSDAQLEALDASVQDGVHARGAHATLAGIRANDATVMHIVAHGIYAAQRAQPSGILLSPTAESPSGAIFSDELRRIRFERAPRVALISACSAGSGPLRPGDAEASTLTGALLDAGVSAVVAPSADVEVEPTLRLMARVQRELRDGASPAHALRAARRELFDAGYTDPRAFATLHATGLAHRPAFPKPPRRHYALVVWSAAALVGAYWIARRRQRKRA